LIDIHSHIIPGVDDGAQTLEDSCAMLRVAAEHGTTDIVATPHASPEFRYDAAQVDRLLADVRMAAGPLIRVHRGCDFHLTFENIQDALQHPERYTVNGKRYLLVEFSDLVIFRTTDQVFDQFLSVGIVPIVTHPERNPLLRQRMQALHDWAQRGVLMQVTAQSLTGFWGRDAQRFTDALLEEGLAHVFASDAHDARRRPPVLDEAFEEIRDRYGTPAARELFIDVPRAVIDGIALPPPVLPRRRPVKKWFKFW
jgi:protein-tyrosine phosphatase